MPRRSAVLGAGSIAISHGIALEPVGSVRIVVMDMAEAPHLSPRASLVQELVCAGAANSEYVKDVYVGGRKVLSDGRPVTIDVRAAIRASNALQDELFEELSLARFRRGDTAWTWVRSCCSWARASAGRRAFNAKERGGT